VLLSKLSSNENRVGRSRNEPVPAGSLVLWLAHPVTANEQRNQEKMPEISVGSRGKQAISSIVASISAAPRTHRNIRHGFHFVTFIEEVVL
jgi:hypothetical protein